MEAGAATAPQAATRARAKTKKKAHATAAKMPWWMWIAVVAIVVFCLFPFYWLINISLKTGNDLQSSSLIPPHPTLKNYKDDLQEPRLHQGAAQQRGRRAEHDRARARASGRSAPTRWRG